MIIKLTEMRPNETGAVKTIESGAGAIQRLQSMGIREGRPIKKLGPNSSQGAQTIIVGNMRFAIGFGMAENILVEVRRDEAE